MDNSRTNALVEMIKANQKLLLYAVPAILTLFFVILGIIFLQPTQPIKQPTNQSGLNATPTANPTVQAQKMNILSVSPQNNATGVTIFTPITVTFSRDIQKTDQQRTEISTVPPTSGSYTWSNNRTLVFTPVNSFVSQTQYTAYVLVDDERFTWNFQTIPNDKMSEADIMKVEKESADFTKQQDAEFDKNYPWWNRFPVQSKKYFAYFDPNQKKFIGLLYPSRSEAQSQDAQVTQMKNEILGYIRAQGINVDQYGIEWKITPEP